MNYATIKKTDVANGPGVRVSLFVSGCTHHCKGCFNSEAWDFHYGQAYTEETEQEILQALAPDYIRGLSLLGGEPMEPENRGAVLSLVKKVREQYPQKTIYQMVKAAAERNPQKTIWCYTGYHFDRDLLRWMEEGDPVITELLPLLDVIVDGEFIEERKNLRLAFRGSENQRILDVQLSLKEKCGKLLAV